LHFTNIFFRADPGGICQGDKFLAIKVMEKPAVRPEWLLVGNPNAIKAQEFSEQQKFVNSTELPLYMSEEDKSELIKMGVVFGEAVDDLFINALLPDGWKKISTDHSMWSNLVDDEDKIITQVFYKGAFYDRDAFLRLVIE
jgi:hypothetical protein